MSEHQKNNTKLFESAVEQYLEACSPIKMARNSQLIPEFEIRFGIRTPLMKTDYDNIVHLLRSSGWKSDNLDGIHLLRITTEYYNIHAAKQNLNKLESEDELFGGAPLPPSSRQFDRPQSVNRMSNVRAEIVGAELIQMYCKTNSLEKVLQMPGAYKVLKFTQKTPSDRPIGPVVNGIATPFINFNEFNFRISSQYETNYSINDNSEKIRRITNDWNTSKKHFRCINRVRFAMGTESDSMVFVDLSIIKNNRTTTSNRKKIPIPTVTIQDATVFNNPESYEVELELDNDMATKLMDKMPKAQVHHLAMAQLRKSIRLILSALQETAYPISYDTQDTILREYMRQLMGEDWEPRYYENADGGKSLPFFVGPSSVTLQIHHLLQDRPINIVNNYCVTEKADGERALLYVSNSGEIYLINSSLKVIFTGTKTEDKSCFGTIIDGEYISHGKNGQVLHLYAAFDIYHIGSSPKRNIRELAFSPNQREENEMAANEPDVANKKTDPKDDKEMQEYRLYLLRDVIEKLQPVSATGNPLKCPFRIQCKQFYMDSADKNIFAASAMLLNRQDLFEYEIDGLIYTPINTGVGSSAVGVASELKKVTWDRSFKWKPPKYNTIDFLVAVEKNKNGKDKIYNKIVQSNDQTGSIYKYKRIILHCGFDEHKDKYMNPFHDVLHDITKRLTNASGEDDVPTTTLMTTGSSYKPTPFQPTSPYDPDACYCNILLSNDENANMCTIDGDTFYENMIVEFKYDLDIVDEGGISAWKWKPIRVRYDKTSQLRANQRNYGNHFSTANSNWHSIHFPVTENMISGIDTPNESVFEDALYYDRKEKDTQETESLRDFHNLYVKRFLIERVATYLNSSAHVDSILLVDFAVGKAGDLSKWTWSNIKFVFGVDITLDNIMNAKDGACVRYLGTRNRDTTKPLRAIFLRGNSSLNIRTNGQAFFTNQDKQISDALFGQETEAKTQIAQKYYGIGRDGFHMGSCQFAMHYMFKSIKSLHGFLRNLSECIRKGGYYVGTCYNGQRVFDLLRQKERGESFSLYKNNKRIFEITKDYQQSEFTDSAESVGMAIQVYQESIDTTNEEYLVNFAYFTRLMDVYGFIPLPKSECKLMNFNEPVASFKVMFEQMRLEIKADPSITDYHSAALLSSKSNDAEKTISFLNEYFIFKKVRDVSPEMMRQITKRNELDEEKEAEDDKEQNVIVDKKLEAPRVFVKKQRGKRIILSVAHYHPISEKDDNLQDTEKEIETDKEIETEKEKDTGDKSPPAKKAKKANKLK